MLTQEQALAELRQLNQELGLPEDDGVPMTQAQAEAELRALDEELASTPESFGEYVERRKFEDSRSLGDKTSAFTDSFLTGAGALASEGSKAIGELFSGNVGKSEIGGVFKIGMADFGRFAETLGGAAMDNFYSDEVEMKREYERYKDNFLYNQNVRTAMLNTYDEEGRDFISFGANFVDPTLLIPGAGLLTKGASLGAKAVATGAKAGAFAARSPRLVQLSKAMAKTSRGAQKVAKGLDKVSDVASIPAKLAASGTRKAIKGSALVGAKVAGGVGRTGEAVSKVAALPRTAVTGFASKFIDPKIAGSGILGAQATGALTGAVPGLGLLTGAEALGYIANKTGRGVERTLSALSSTGGQKRFLQRLATSADSPRLRKLALMAHAGGATKLTDLAFNSLVNGASVGVLNGALAYASGEGAEGVGAAVGSGTLMGGSLPFGQPGMKGGKSQAARDQSSINFLNAKLADDQIKQFKNLSAEARLAFATVEEAGIPRPQLAFLDKQTYLDLLRKDDPNLRSAPNAHYGIADNTIYINQDGNAGRSSKEAMDILTHELGHHFIKQAIKDDPFFAEKILSEYKTKPGEESFDFAFTTDSAGAPIDSIKLNKKAVDIADLYGGIQDGIGIGRNAEKLAQEIGAEQFAMMMVDNPNIFNTIEPSLRQKLLDGSRKVLTMFGAVDPYTGNPLDVSILGPEGVKSKNPLVQRSKSIRNLYKNYVKQREYALADKIDLAENPMKIKLQRGEKPQQAVQRLFNTKGISLKEAKAFRINNLKVKEKLVEIKKRLLENPTGGMRAFVNKSGNAIAIIGKTLTPEVRSVFTGNDPFGNINTLINVAIDGIREKAQFTFLYRAGKPSKYSDNELRPRVVSPIQLIVTGLSDNSKSAASLKLDCFDEAYLRNNAEVLVQEGFAKDPKTLIEEGRRVAKESLNDPEGRINPKGEKENELVTALFGQPESAGFIKNKKLRALLDPEQGGRLKHAFRSYDFDALAGLVPTGRDGISFDWDNVKHNHMPLDDKLFIPAYHGTPHTLAPEAGAPLGKFRTSKIGTGEGSQAYGHGLYFAGKRDVAEHYRKVLSGKKDDISQDYDGKPFDRTNPKHEAARRLNKEAKMLGVSKNQVRPRVIDQIKGQLQRRDLDRSVKERLSDVSKVLENKQEAKTNEGSLYKVELAPKENEYLLWDKPLSEQPKAVKESIKQVYLGKELPGPYQTQISYPGMKSFIGQDLPSTPKQEAVLTLLGEKGNKLSAAEILKNDSKALEALAGIEYSKIKETPYGQVLGLHIYNDLKFGSNPIAASAALKEAGIPGIKYLDGSSRSKGEGDYNYVIFDEADVQITDKLFMPASEAGAGKGKQAEAAKLWNEKGTDSPYFKKWFGKSKVVDENGEPLVVYHGTSDQFTAFDADRYQSINKGDFGEGFYFTPKKGQAKLYSQDAIKKTDPEVLALQKEYEAQAKQLGTSTMMAAIDLGLNSPEYKKLQQFENRLDQKLQSINKGNDEIIIDSYLSLENPLIVKSTSASDPFLAQSAKERGHDGIIVKFDNGRVDEIVAFSPEQIKSATGNRGTFDAGERNILFMPQMAMKNDPSVKYHYDTQTMDRPPVKDVSALSGERLAGVLEADRHDARGGRMAGPAHPFLKSNQATATVDGIKWKPVWANMKYQFVKTQIGKQMKSTNGYNLVAIMDEFAHRSNRDVFTRMMKKIQSASKKMTPEQKLVTAQIINIFDIRYTPKKERGNKLKESMLSFVSDLGTAKSQATRNNMEGFNKLLKKSVDKVKSNSWWDSQSIKSNSKDFRKYTKDMTFNKRGAILKALEGLPWLPDIQKFLKSEMDFEGAPTDKAVLAVQLSKHKLNSDERVFAIYTGKDPDQARWMTKNEREVLRQLRADPNFREHPSYDWMMLGKADSDNFYLDKPVNLDKLIPTYRKDHKRSKTQEYKAQLSKTKNYLSKTPKSKGFLFSGKGDKADNAFLKTFSETKSKKSSIENVYKGKERLVVGAMKRNAKVPIIIP